MSLAGDYLRSLEDPNSFLELLGPLAYPGFKPTPYQHDLVRRIHEATGTKYLDGTSERNLGTTTAIELYALWAAIFSDQSTILVQSNNDLNRYSGKHMIIGYQNLRDLGSDLFPELQQRHYQTIQFQQTARIYLRNSKNIWGIRDMVHRMILDCVEPTGPVLDLLGWWPHPIIRIGA